MAAGLGFKTFNTGDVLSAADTNGYLMQGIWVFADAAARTAAVTSPQEGNMSFLKDTNSTEYYSGSAWVAVGGASASGLTLVKSQTIGSAVSSVTVTDAFSATYDNYLITVSGGVASTSGNCVMTLGSTTANYYMTGVFFSPTASTVNGFNINNGSGWTSTYFGTNNNSGHINLQSPFLSKRTTFTSFLVGAVSTSNFANYLGFLDNATSYTAFTLTASTGTLTGGVIRVYGYQNS